MGWRSHITILLLAFTAWAAAEQTDAQAAGPALPSNVQNAINACAAYVQAGGVNGNKCNIPGIGGGSSAVSSAPRPALNPAVGAINSIRNNLQRNNQIINNATNQLLNTIQPTQAPTYPSDANVSPAPDYGNSTPPPNDLFNSNSNWPPSPPAQPGGDAGVAASISNVLDRPTRTSNSNVAADVSNILDDDTPNSNVAGDVSNVLGGGALITANNNNSEIQQELQEASADIPQPNNTVQVAQQMANADDQVMGTASASSPATSDEVTHQTEDALPPEENSPTLGGWFKQKLTDNLPGILYSAQGQVSQQLAESSSNDPVGQTSNKIFLDAAPATGLGPAMASSPGNPIGGIYNYLNRLVGDSNTLLHNTGIAFGLIIDPDRQ